jgi:hypothetical protein
VSLSDNSNITQTLETSPENEEPIYDPYLAAAVEQGMRAAKQERGRQKLLLWVAVSALVTALGAVGILVWGAYHWRQLLDRQEDLAADEDDSTTKRTGLAPSSDDKDDEDSDAAARARAEGVPETTTATPHGGIEVVDLGLTSQNLRAALADQQAQARTKSQTVLVMLTGRRCTPCRGVDAALESPMVQDALRGVRLVRVDLNVFQDELKAMRVPTNVYPAFFLLGTDARPIDGIHGGEWDEDTAANIAPVLGAFVHGTYKKRRHNWSPTTTAIPI